MNTTNAIERGENHHPIPALNEPKIKISEIKQQRPDRISLILNKLEQNGYLESIDTPNAKFYLITDKGFDAYLKWIKEFLTFVRIINNEDTN